VTLFAKRAAARAEQPGFEGARKTPWLNKGFFGSSTRFCNKGRRSCYPIATINALTKAFAGSWAL
jgi:hypothetical protein